MTDFPGVPARFELENDSIVFDVIDGDTVIMNLGRGTYYALNPAAGFLWQLIVTGIDVSDISQKLKEKGLAIQDAELHAFVQQLIELNLIARAGKGVLHTGQPAADVELSCWDHPRITEYTDMKDLLAMDPPLPDPKTR